MSARSSTIMTAPLLLPSFLLELLSEEENIDSNAKRAIIENTPTNTIETMSRCTSWLRMCDSSCAMTASNSSSFSLFIIPFDNVTVYVRSLIPLAKALSDSSFIILIFGILIPWLMQRFSTRL